MAAQGTRVPDAVRREVPRGFTRRYGIDRLVYLEAFDSVLEARAREHALKRWRRAWKISLIEGLNPDWRDPSDQLNSGRRPPLWTPDQQRTTPQERRVALHPGNVANAAP
jgi:putative endonuclease